MSTRDCRKKPDTEEPQDSHYRERQHKTIIENNRYLTEKGRHREKRNRGTVPNTSGKPRSCRLFTQADIHRRARNGGAVHGSYRKSHYPGTSPQGQHRTRKLRRVSLASQESVVPPLVITTDEAAAALQIGVLSDHSLWVERQRKWSCLLLKTQTYMAQALLAKGVTSQHRTGLGHHRRLRAL